MTLQVVENVDGGAEVRMLGGDSVKVLTQLFSGLAPDHQFQMDQLVQMLLDSQGAQQQTMLQQEIQVNQLKGTKVQT